ncbi:helix-turn-helix domain-containing protein [Ruegeria sp. HKCCD6109]|nr:helix-turn-helix domain-containing protein [Ruegeria sp. HKCCD6109]
MSLAEKAGLSRTAVHAILKGRIASPRVDTLERIADALGVTIYELMADMTDEELIAEINALIAAIPEKDRPRIRDMIAGFVRMLPTAAI